MNDPLRFDPGAHHTFRATGRSFDPESRTVTLGYAFDGGPSFVETITFETPPVAGRTPDLTVVDRALLHLHIAAGTSYYKAAAPPTVVVEDAVLTASETSFHHHLYDDGLREFAVENGLGVPRSVRIESGGGNRSGGGVPSADPTAPSHPSHPSHPSSPRETGRLLVPIGGGKDSMVLIEALAPFGPTLFAVNPHPLVVDLARRAGRELVVVRRRIDPGLLALNGHGARNGHVPITAIVSLIAVMACALYGQDSVAMAIERSASEETVMVDGVPVNHQYSKSLDFERQLSELVANSIDPSLTYGSGLRPYSELDIARAFATLTGYHATFCSCNTVFRQSAGATDGWCGRCPKCRFVALMLAPFMDRGSLTAILGTDLFADPDQVPGFAALMSDDDKPFECVGERRESAAAMRMLAAADEWKGSPVVAALADRAADLVSEGTVAELLTPDVDLSFPDPEVAAEVERFFLAVR
jgi:hypothetical protein